MNSRATIILISLLQICMYEPVVAQSEPDVIIEQIIESVTENAGEDFDYSELGERLNFYSKNPINLNKALPEQLNELIFLSPLQINALLKYREKNGAFIDLLELQSIEGFDLETINKLLPFVSLITVNPLSDISTRKLLHIGTQDIMLRYGQVIQKQLGYLIPDSSAKSHYMGTPQRMFIRYRYNYGQHVSAVLNMEKDAGERLFAKTGFPGFDFYSGNIFLKNIGIFRKVAIGDYAMQFGQGLTLWTGLGFGKGAAVSTITKPDIGLRPYSSANEALYFRGLATTLDFSKLSFTPFISYKSQDAGLTGTNDDQEVTSFSQAGLHRTANEIKNKDALKQLVYGLNIQYNSANFNAGIVGYQTRFNYAFEPSPDLYKKFEFNGNSLFNTGLYYNRNWRNIYLFGEFAHSLNSGFAYVNGVIASLSPQVSLVLLHRNYQKNYQSFYSSSISESSKATNEQGFYSGLTITPAPRFELTVYSDFFRFPWLKFRVDAPSKGYEVSSQLSYTIKKKLKASLRYKLEEKEQNSDSENIVNFLTSVQKQNYRAELNYTINNEFQLRNRVEIIRYKKATETIQTGSILLQDIIYNPMQSRFSGNLRFAIFDTDGFDSRIYSYENDVLYSYSVPALQDRGIRFYVNGRYTVKRGIDLWFKYSITKYTNVNEIGSGLDMVEGNKKSDIKMQLRFQF
jgi:hypothetical protein